MEEDMNNKTPVISIRQAVDTIKSAILQSQARAAQVVSQEQLALYYGIGRYVSANSREGYWGTGAIDNISKLLKAELPGLKGFSPSMIKRMRIFYEEWQGIERSSVIPITENEKYDNSNESGNSVIRINELDTIRPLVLTNFEDFPLLTSVLAVTLLREV